MHIYKIQINCLKFTRTICWPFFSYGICFCSCSFYVFVSFFFPLLVIFSQFYRGDFVCISKILAGSLSHFQSKSCKQFFHPHLFTFIEDKNCNASHKCNCWKAQKLSLASTQPDEVIKTFTLIYQLNVVR